VRDHIDVAVSIEELYNNNELPPDIKGTPTMKLEFDDNGYEDVETIEGDDVFRYLDTLRNQPAMPPPNRYKATQAPETQDPKRTVGAAGGLADRQLDTAGSAAAAGRGSGVGSRGTTGPKGMDSFGSNGKYSSLGPSKVRFSGNIDPDNKDPKQFQVDLDKKDNDVRNKANEMERERERMMEDLNPPPM